MIDSTRRNFLKTAGGAVAAASIAASPILMATNAAAQSSVGSSTSSGRTPFEKIKLPYAYNALEPHIDAATMEIHYSKHYNGYVNGLNKATEALAKARTDNDFSLIQYWSGKQSFNYGGYYLHTMFWQIMAAPGNGGGGDPTGDLADQIRRDFGSVTSFKAQFTAASAAVEGSGWGLVHYRPDDNRLEILQAQNQNQLAQWGAVPIMGVDVWEHAYYLKYQNRRKEYINNWWNVVNWSAVAQRLQAARRS